MTQKNLIKLLIVFSLWGCQTVPAKLEPKPYYDFEILETSQGQKACLSQDDLKKLFKELSQCRGR